MSYIIHFLSYIIHFLSYIIHFLSYIIRFLSYIIRFLSYIIRFSSYIIRFLSYIIRFLKALNFNPFVFPGDWSFLTVMHYKNLFQCLSHCPLFIPHYFLVYTEVLIYVTLCFRKPFLVIIVSFFPIKCYKYQAEICSIS